MTDTKPRSRRRRAEIPNADLQTCVNHLVNVVDKGAASEAAPYDLIPLEFSLLRACMEKGECTATQLAEVLPVDASRISRVVNRMVDMGLLRRRRLRSDRRIVMLTLTPRGNDLTLRIHQRVQVYDAKLIDGVSEREMRSFVATTFKILANYNAMKEAE